MTLTEKGTETRLRIIRTAADLFHKQGLHATSPDEVIESSQTGKGQFYYYFKNKEGLIHEVLMWHLEAIRNGSSPINYNINSFEDLREWFRSHIELQKTFGMIRGCPFGTAANEVNEGDEQARKDLELIFDEIRDRLAAFFIREKTQHRLARDANEGSLADFCIAAIQGAMLIGKLRRSSNDAEAIVREALAHIRSNLYLISEFPTTKLPSMVDALYEDKFAQYFRDSEHAIIEQCWLEATSSMTEEQFRAGVQRLAELIEREHLPNVIVDVVKMGYRPAADFEAWRQAFIIPRYNSAGVRKFAFVFPSDFPGTVENGVSPAAEGKAMFPFGYFASHEGALAWLAT